MSDNAPQNNASIFKMQAPESLVNSGSDATFYISESALERLRVLKKQRLEKNPDQPAPSALRISVLSGGCYGFQYSFDFTAETTEDDYVFVYEDVNLVVDNVSFDLLEDTVLDYVQELIGAAFTLKNPNSESSCGCGNSFSI